MLKSYFKVAFRYLAKHKGYSVINVLGLSVGIACCILIMQFVKSEWSFDRFHSKSDRIYRAWLQEHYQGEVFNNVATPIPLVPVLQAALPEAEASCRTAGRNTLVQYNNTRLNAQVDLVDSSFFGLFDFTIKEGDARNPFPTGHSVVITEDEAKRFFGREPAIGKALQVQLNDSLVLFTVSAVAANSPRESSLQFSLLIPFSNASYLWSEKTRTSAWSNVTVQSFVLLKEGASLPAVHQKIDATMQPLVAKNYKPGEYNVRLQPLTDIYFNTLLPEEVESDSDPKYSYILATIGGLILLIACINFVTLSMGRSVARSLEVGVRKVLGAGRQQLIGQFWGEALLLTLLSVVTGIGLALLLQKPFNSLANRQLSFELNAFTVGFLLLLTILIGLVAGLYPALVLSRFRPVQVLKGKLQLSSMGLFRKGLVVAQFVAAIVLIIATITVGRQLDHLRTKDLGFNREHVIVVPTGLPISEGRAFAKKLQVELEKNPQVESSTASLYALHNYGWMTLGYNDDKNVFRRFRFNLVDEDFVPTMQLKVVRGRNFQKGATGDSAHILVNEALVKEYGWKDAIGQKLPGKYTQTVIGVVKDFNTETLYTPVAPAVLSLRGTDAFSNSSDVSYDAAPSPRISVRFRPGQVQEHVAFLKESWKKIAGDREFDHTFLDEALAASYAQEQRLSKIAAYASVLAIFIACMGLFGLATLMVVRRTREIGIRKVLGADVPNIVTLLSKDFLWLVLVASLVAFPVAWWALSKWLEDFAFRIAVPPLAFIGASVLVLVVALLTVGAQSVRAALMNPVKSLRSE